MVVIVSTLYIISTSQYSVFPSSCEWLSEKGIETPGGTTVLLHLLTLLSLFWPPPPPPPPLSQPPPTPPSKSQLQFWQLIFKQNGINKNVYVPKRCSFTFKHQVISLEQHRISKWQAACLIEFGIFNWYLGKLLGIATLDVKEPCRRIHSNDIVVQR